MQVQKTLLMQGILKKRMNLLKTALLKRQEKEANEEAEALRKEFAQETENLIIQEGAAKASISTASPHEGLDLSDPTNPEQDDLEIPPLKDIYQNSSDGIFTTSSYDDEGVQWLDVHRTVETVVIYVQKQRKITHKDFQHCLFACFLSQHEPKKISEALEDESWVDAMQEELLQFEIQKVWILVDLPFEEALATKRGFVAETKQCSVMQRPCKSSSIHNALTVSPVISTTFVEQFWTSAKSKIINNVRHITAKVAGQSVSISEASIRSDFLFYDADGIDSLPNQAIFNAIQLMGTSWDQIPTNIATAVIYLTSNQKYIFSKLIFDDHFPVNTLTSKVFSFMVKKGKHFSGNVTPLFASMLVQPTEDEGAHSERPSEAQPTPSPAPTSKVPNESHIDSSPAQTSEVPIEEQTDLSPRPSPTTIIPDSIPETSGGNLGGHSSSDKSLSGNEGDMTLQSVYDLCLSLCAHVSDQAKEILHLKAQIKKLKKQATPVIKHHRAWMQRRKFAKGESSVQRDPLFDEIPEDTVNHMETENAQNEGRIKEMVDEDKEIDENILSTEDILSTDMEKVSTDRPIVSTDGSKVSTDRQNEGTKEHIEGTEGQNESTEGKNESTDGQRKGDKDHTEEEIAAQTTQTPTSTK
ncbi:hypothetical protein Tco_1051565 [Tanacetum coccineum]